MAVPPPPTFEEFGDNIFSAPPRKPTLEQRGREADIKQSEASTEKTVAETGKLNLTLPSVKQKADADAAVASYNAANVGFEDANKEFQKQYVAWRSGSAADFFDKIKQLQKAVRVLRSGRQITGPLFNQLPPLVKTLVSPQSTDVRADVEKVVQGALRETLGAQFTQVEGDRLLARIFDPSLPEAFVAENVEAELNKIAALAKSREAMARYYEENSTLKGYRPDEWLPQVEADFKVMQNVPKDARAAVEETNYREAMNNIGGDPLKGWRLRPGEEQQIIDYANSADFTPEGFVDMLGEMITLASGQEPDRAALMAEARAIAERPEGARLGSVDYSNVDEAAARNAGLSDVAIQALKNAPASATMVVSSLLSPVSDALRSTVLGERVGFYKTFPDLIADVASKAGIGETDEATANALADAMVERYGSFEGFKQAVASDPVGVVGDASVILTLGGSAAGRVPGVVGRAGRATARLGEAIDPLSFAGSMVSRGFSALPEGVKTAPSRVATEGLSMTTGAPAGAFREAFERGAGRQRVGVTPLTEEFRAGIAGGIPPEDLVARAKSAMQEMREAASRDYRSGMVDISQDKSILSFDELDKALADMRRDAMYKGEVVKPDVLATVDEMEGIINDWRALDPAEFHTPEGFDKLKQRLFEATEGIPLDDRARRRAASAVYGATKDTIRKQAPTYSSVMDQYADAQQTLGRMESELGLGRGPIDTAATKLTQRPPSRKGRDDLLSMLADYDPKLAAQVAGEQLSPIMPRGLRGVGAGLGTALAVGNVASLGTLSPRVMGEVAYGAGRASVPIGQTVDFIRQNPTATLAAQRGIAAMEATEAERAQQELLERYGLLMPPTIGEDGTLVDQMTPEMLRAAAAQPEPQPIDLGGFEPQYEEAEPTGEAVQTTRIIDGRITDIDPVTGQRIFLDTGEPVQGFKRGGAVRGYQEGGRVGETAFQRRQREQQERQAAAARRVQQQMEADRQRRLAANQRNIERARAAGRGQTVSEGRGYNTNAARARTALQGLTLAFGDEAEAALREGVNALTEMRLPTLAGYYGIKDDINRGLERYAADNPGEALLFEGGGAALIGLIPGAQGATATRLAALASRYPTRAALARLGAESAAYGVGAADRPSDVPRSVAEEGVLASLMYGGARVGGAGVRKGAEFATRASNRGAAPQDAPPTIENIIVYPEFTPEGAPSSILYGRPMRSAEEATYASRNMSLAEIEDALASGVFRLPPSGETRHGVGKKWWSPADEEGVFGRTWAKGSGTVRVPMSAFTPDAPLSVRAAQRWDDEVGAWVPMVPGDARKARGGLAVKKAGKNERR